jgi:ammonium transporter, Amt family
MDKDFIDAIWMMSCTMIVVMMQAGFLCLETGQTRTRHVISVAYKNIADMCIVTVIFFLFSYQYIYSNESLHWSYFSKIERNPFELSFFMLQMFFCCTAITIVSGAIAERTRSLAYIFIAAITAGITYPIVAQLTWGGQLNHGELGWLRKIGFVDFAGASVVHSLGGWVGLASVIIIGPRLGRYSKKRSEKDKVYSGNVPLTILGMFLLLFGWLGFNAGSTFSLNTDVVHIVFNTIFAGMASGFTLLFLTYCTQNPPPVMHLISVILGAMVAISACSNMVDSFETILIGVISCFIVLLSIDIMERLKLDDVFQVVSCHLPCGIWGCICVALFGDTSYWTYETTRLNQLGIQAIGCLSVGVISFSVTYVSLSIIKQFMPLRVTPKQELIGLNIAEHHVNMELSNLLHNMKIQSRNINKKVDFGDHLYTDGGRISFYYKKMVSSFIDSYQELKETREKLQESERKSISGQIAAGVAHEIKNPLGVIMGGIEYLSRQFKGEESNPNVTMTLEHATISSNRINKIVQELLDINQASELKVDSLNINDIIRLTLEEHAPLLLKDINIELLLDESISIANLDKEKIDYTLINILVNAAHSMEEHNLEGIKTIEIQTYNINKNIEDTPTECIGIKISDNGPGFDEKIKEKLFDPFFTTRRARGGSGLGLSLVKQFIDLHHGLVIPYNHPKHSGAVIEIIIPTNYSDNTNTT